MADLRIQFLFNKAHNTDPTIPCWILKSKGETYYVDHVVCNSGFSTKETPNNSHTKGSIMVKGIITVTEDAGVKTATINAV